MTTVHVEEHLYDALAEARRQLSPERWRRGGASLDGWYVQGKVAAANLDKIVGDALAFTHAALHHAGHASLTGRMFSLFSTVCGAWGQTPLTLRTTWEVDTYCLEEMMAHLDETTRSSQIARLVTAGYTWQPTLDHPDDPYAPGVLWGEPGTTPTLILSTAWRQHVQSSN